MRGRVLREAEDEGIIDDSFLYLFFFDDCWRAFAFMGHGLKRRLLEQILGRPGVSIAVQLICGG